MNSAVLKSENLATLTPGGFLCLVEAVAPIALDPCADRRGLVNARVKLYPRRGWRIKPDPGHGLTADWRALARGGLVYVNPPYGRQIDQWARKVKLEAERGTEICMLTAARTDTRWFHTLVTRDPVKRAILFWRGRIRFVGQPSCAPFPSAVFYWGPRRNQFVRVFSRQGWLILP